MKGVEEWVRIVADLRICNELQFIPEGGVKLSEFWNE
jgi:hypothetical protein